MPSARVVVPNLLPGMKDDTTGQNGVHDPFDAIWENMSASRGRRRTRRIRTMSATRRSLSMTGVSRLTVTVAWNPYG